MSSAIGFIVFGIDITDYSYGLSSSARDSLKKFKDEEGCILTRHLEEDTPGFFKRYSGNGDQPTWFGINLGTISEHDKVDGDWLREKLTVTESIHKTYKEMVDGLSEYESNQEFIEVFKSYEPSIMILWGSS